MEEKIVIFGDDPAGHTGFGRIVDHLVEAVRRAGAAPVVVARKVRPGFAIVDVERMARGLLALAEDPERRTSMGEEGRRIALGLSWETFVEAWASLLRETRR